MRTTRGCEEDFNHLVDSLLPSLSLSHSLHPSPLIPFLPLFRKRHRSDRQSVGTFDCSRPSAFIPGLLSQQTPITSCPVSRSSFRSIRRALPWHLCLVKPFSKQTTRAVSLKMVVRQDKFEGIDFGTRTYECYCWPTVDAKSERRLFIWDKYLYFLDIFLVISHSV